MLTDSNVGRWDKFYVDVTNPQAYGDSDSYRIGADHLADCDRVEDWGCGLGWFRRLIDGDRYVGVDGSYSKFADVIVDLETHRSETSGLFMRHVLEHNYNWQIVLGNALASFTKRMVLVTFTPWTGQAPHEQLRFEDDYAVPTLALNRAALVDHFAVYTWTQIEVDSPETYYGHETVFVIDR